MKHIIKLSTFLLLVPSVLWSQHYVDTIFTDQFDTIVCQINHLDKANIYYQFLRSDSSIDSTSIAKSAVVEISHGKENLKDVSVHSQQTASEAHESQFTVSEGIIHQSDLESPPVFQNGKMDLMRYLQNHIVVEASYAQIFGNTFVTILYEATIDEYGNVKHVDIAQSSVSTGNVSQGSSIAEQIKGVISEMPPWTPAIVNNEPSKSEVYIPVKFRMEQNAIVMYSGHHTFVFNTRN